MAFKFGAEYHHVTDNTLQMFRVKGQRLRSRGQRSMSQCKVMYQQQKRPQWIGSATFNLAWRHNYSWVSSKR